MARGALWDKEERKMRRWVWRILLTAVVMAALTVGASAAEVTVDGIKYDTATGTVLGPENQSSIKTAKILSEVNGAKITKIASNAFGKCQSLTTVEIEDGITHIGDHAFSGCSSLQAVYFPDSIKEIGSFAFSSCGRLTQVIIPSQVTVIQEGTFSGCTRLTGVYIPSSVTTIEDDAFTLAPKTLILHCATKDGPPFNAEADREIHKAVFDPQQNTAPGCVTPGEERVIISCGTCNRVIIDQPRVIPPLGHKADTVLQPAIPSTCSTPGRTEGHLCAVCGQPADGMVEAPLDPANHEKLETMEDVPPTCTVAGSKGGQICTACGVETVAPTPDPALGHDYTDCDYTEPEIVKNPTCTEKGLTVQYRICTRENCKQPEVCDQCEKLKEAAQKDPAKLADYEAHLRADTTKHKLDEPAATGHTPGGDQYVVTKKPTCTTEGKEEWKVICTVCGEPIEDGHTTPPNGEYVRTIPATGHTPTRNEIDKDKSRAATCTAAGVTVYKPTECRVCHNPIPERQETIEALGHDLTAPVDVPKQNATCQTDGIVWKNYQECKREGCDYKIYEEVISKGPHTWTNPQPDEDLKDQDKAATCGEEGVSHVIVTCSVCGKVEHQTITIPATGIHEYGEWTVTKQPTATEEGEESRTCSKCGKVDTRPISPTGPVDPDDPDDPDKPDKPENSDFKIVVIPPSNGSVTASRSTAKQGETVTVTYTANSGYVLDMIRVIGGASLVSYTDLGGGQIRFTMPASDVEVRVTFDQPEADYSDDWAGGFGSNGQSRSDPRRTTDVVPVQRQGYSVPQAEAQEQVFQDVPTGHWAAGEINWASEMGYMSGTGGRFDPDGLISHQQMWMVLARLTGANPANMKEARSWAVRGGYADGSAPTGAVKRHQLVTALYRCARLTGTVSRNNTSLAGFTDSTAVPVRAREAFSWALTSGVVSGDAEGRLNPAKTLTRAEFASILYCYSQRH